MTVEMTRHVYDIGIRGDHSSQVVFVCDLSDRDAVLNTYLGAVDADYPNLVFKHANVRHLQNKDNVGKYEITLDSAPKLSIDVMKIDLPLKWRLEIGSECVTVRGNYTWPDGEPLLNRRILPVKRFTTTRLVLYGTRSSFDLSKYASYEDHVNTDTFLGAEPGTLFYGSTQAQQQQLLDGSIVYPIELHLIHRPNKWNYFYREDKATFEQLYDQNGDLVYPGRDFGDLLNI